ncbi:DUF4956 domain-containing protein [Draconibacterium sp.]|jgi:hypothetical protein
MNETLIFMLQNPIDYSIMVDFFVRLFFNYITLFVLVRYVYYPNNGQKELIFTFVTIGLVVFLISSALSRVSIEFGFALGLFAVFSILRYRTAPIEMKELTYLAATVGISAINALVDSKNTHWLAFIIADVILIGSAYFLEKYSPKKAFAKKMLSINYAEFQHLNDNKLLLAEVNKLTNLDAFKVEIIKINASKNEIVAWVYYREL